MFRNRVSVLACRSNRVENCAVAYAADENKVIPPSVNIVKQHCVNEYAVAQPIPGEELATRQVSHNFYIANNNTLQSIMC